MTTLNHMNDFLWSERAQTINQVRQLMQPEDGARDPEMCQRLKVA